MGRWGTMGRLRPVRFGPAVATFRLVLSVEREEKTAAERRRRGGGKREGKEKEGKEKERKRYGKISNLKISKK
jgi:hypothetical protein